MVSGLGGDIGLGLGVDRGALVGDLGDVAVDVVGGVLHMLDPAVGKGDRVRSRDNTVGIAGLSSVEVGLGVVVGNTVGVGVGLRGLLCVHNSDRGVVSRGSHLHNRGRGMVGRGGVDNGGSVDNRGGMVDSVGHNRGSVGNCVVSHDGGSVDSVVGERGGVHKRGGVVDGVRDDWGSVSNSVVGHGVVGNRVGDDRGSVDSVGNGVGDDRGSVHSVGNGGSVDSVGNRVGDSVDGVVGGHDLAVAAVGHGGGTGVGEVGAGARKCVQFCHRARCEQDQQYLVDVRAPALFTDWWEVTAGAALAKPSRAKHTKAWKRSIFENCH